MSTRLKKIMSLLIAVALTVSLFPLPTAKAAIANGVQSALNSVINDYPSGSFFTVNKKACTHGVRETCSNCSLKSICNATGKQLPPGQGDAHTCLAFACYVINQVFGIKYAGNTVQIGAKKPSNQASTFQGAKVGDLVHFYDKNGRWGHVAVCMGVSDDSITLYECNATSQRSQVTCRTIPYAQMQSKSYHSNYTFCTVFRAKNYDKINNSVTVETPKVTITFDANGGSVSPAQLTYKKNSNEKFPTPTREGYRFVGWSFEKEVSGGTLLVSDMSTCEYESDTTLYAVWTQCTHQKGTYLWHEDSHPHYNYYTCSICGAKFSDGSTSNVESCKTCNPDPKEPEKKGYWGPWSDWSTTPVTATSTRQVETRQVKVSDARTEYRYAGYVCYDSRGKKHECWCETYMKKMFGSATLRYSNWSTTRYSPNGSAWSCGNCNGNHTGISHYSNGKPWWGEYTLSDGNNYYWEESRTVEAKYETQYRYRDWISG